MSKKQELMDAIQQYPDRRLIAMFSNEGNSDYAYSLGEIEKVEVTETTTYNDERVFFSDEYEELLEIIEDDIHTERYGNQTVNDEEIIAAIEQFAKEEIKKYKWEPVIVIYVGN